MATGIYDPQEEALLRRAHEYATGQIPYANEEDLLNQAQSYAQNPRYWNAPGPPVQTYDPTAELRIPYGQVPESEFMAVQPFQPAEAAAAAPPDNYGMDEDLIGYPQENLAPDMPAGPDADLQGYTQGVPAVPRANRPGFMYTGSVGGEAAAREAWNNAPEVEAPPVDPSRYAGNYYAHRAALEFDARRAEAEQEREIQYAYQQARNANQMKAVEAARNLIGRRAVERDIESGVPIGEAAMRHFGDLNPQATSALTGVMRTVPQIPRVQDLGEGVGKVVVTGNKVQFPPGTYNTANGPVQGEPLIDAQTGQPVKNKVVVRSRNGGFHIVDTSPAKMTAKVTMPGPDALHPGPVISGPVEGMAKYGVTNFSNVTPPAAPAGQVQEIIRVTKDGRRVVYDAVTKEPLRYAD